METEASRFDLFHLQQVMRMLADLGAIHREQDDKVWIEGFEPGPYLSDRQAGAVCRALDALTAEATR